MKVIFKPYGKMAKKNHKERKIDFRHNLKVYLSLVKNYKLLVITLLFFSLAVEATSIADKFIFKGLIDQSTLFAQETVTRQEFTSVLAIIAIAFIAVILARSIAKWLFMHLINRLDASLMFDLKKRFFNHIIHLSYNFHTNNRTGALIARIIRGGSAIEQMTDAIVFNFTPIIFQVAVAVPSILYFDTISAIVLLLTVIVFISYSLFINFIQQGAKLRILKNEDIEKASISDIFTNISSVKCFGKEQRIKNFFLKLIQRTKQSAIEHWDYFRWFDSGQNLILGIGTLLLVYFPIKGFLNGEATIGEVVFIYTIFAGLTGSLFGVVWGMRQFYDALGNCEDLFQYEKTTNEIKDIPNAKKLRIREGEIEFKNVSFSYKEKKLFSNLSLKIPAGTKVALVGPSGGGKTTLVRLLYRLYDINEGQILIDGKNIKNFKQESVRGEMSLVPQEAILFDDTIYNNVAFSRKGATKEDVLRAMRFAQLDRLLKRLPRGYHTIVGERGVKLSGGEKQRVSIARAILANRKVIVLDEATSALDSQTEYEIQRSLQKLMQGKTSIVIAHRLSTIMSADAIVVISRGKVTQIGSHEQLTRQPGIYRKLWKMQKGGYIR